jgi:hypothetical protein
MGLTLVGLPSLKRRSRVEINEAENYLLPKQLGHGGLTELFKFKPLCEPIDQEAVRKPDSFPTPKGTVRGFSIAF